MFAQRGLLHDDMFEYYPREFCVLCKLFSFLSIWFLFALISEGLVEHARRLYARFKLPIIVTELGTATTDCDHRVIVIKNALTLLKAMLDDGIPVLGVFVWSTFDNFEWSLGNRMKFGLVHVDNDSPKPTFARRLKRSGAFYHSGSIVCRCLFDFTAYWKKNNNNNNAVVVRNGFNQTDIAPVVVADDELV